VVLGSVRLGSLRLGSVLQFYGQLFYLLQTDTRYMARLATLVKLGQIDNLLQTVMFTLYGNQYDEYEEHLLLSMFQQVLGFEFENANGISNLMRANTALTRMMTTYTRYGLISLTLSLAFSRARSHTHLARDWCGVDVTRVSSISRSSSPRFSPSSSRRTRVSRSTRSRSTSG